MKAPRFFLGVILLFWGWHHHLLFVAVSLCLIVESIHFLKIRFEFRPADFNKFIDVSIVLLAGTVVIALSVETQKAMSILLRWLPVIFLPIIAAQQFSTKGKIDIRAFFLVGRKKERIQALDVKQIDVSYYYALIVLLSTGMTHLRGKIFYIGIALIFLWALWQVSPRRVPRLVWGLCLFGVVFFGFLGHQAIHRISVKAQMWMIDYFANYHNTNPYKSSTALGDIGNLKLFDEILFRVKKSNYDKSETGILLQNATYNIFATTTWYAQVGFEPVQPGNEKTFWQIQPPVENKKEMTIYSRLVKEKAVLNLPPGVISIGQMKVGTCEKNAMQTVRVEEGPSFIKSLVTYTGNLSYDAAPYERDLMVPKKEQSGIEKIVQDLDLENQSKKQILKTIKSFFSTQYAYSLDLKGKGRHDTPIQNFLYNTKAGHCEFFATTTALTLRQVNIPTRYVTGFIAHEYSRMENCIVVRQRDAHAWVKVYLNGQWENFDTTPASFLQKDSQLVQTSALTNILSFIRFKLFQLRHEVGKKMMEKYGFWLVLPLAIILIFRLKKSNTIKKSKSLVKKPSENSGRSSHDSFFLIEKLLLKKGYPKYSYETYLSWYNRVVPDFDDPHVRDRFFRILSQYNKWRFSRLGIDDIQKRQFDLDIDFILKKIESYFKS